MQTLRERLPRILAASLLLAGCVSLSPEQRAKVDEIQSFADRTTKVYGLPGVRISIQSPTNLNIGAMYRQGNIFVNVRMLDSPNLTKVIAHELGHYVLGHEPASSVSSQADWQRAQQQRELDANAKAVEILVRARGMSQREAVQMVAEALQRAQRAVDRGAPLTPGHLTPAEELADLRARFPEAR
jgi:Zn-dependent peptidase ImmA (M78 family)